MNHLKYLVIIVLFSLCGYLSWNVYFKVYTQDDKVDIHLFPKQIGEWTSEELTITDEEYAILETRNAFVRKYSHPNGKYAYIFMVYSENNRKVSHPPEVCYQGSGLTVVNNKHTAITYGQNGTSVEAVQLLLESNYFQQLAYYWFKVGDTYTSSYWKQQVLIALKTLFRKPSNSALIRVSVDVKKGNTAKAENEAQEFVRLIMPEIGKYLP